MIEAGIESGDYLLVRPQKEAADNEIVVAMIDFEATVKRFVRREDKIFLTPENPRMEPIPLDGSKNFEIVGKVVDVIKRLEV